MRLLARKMGMSLSEHSLNKNVARRGTEKVNTGERLQSPTEESVFKILGIPYRKPEERDF
jgi:DNA polymerase/3'-5' exonuclease PolX